MVSASAAATATTVVTRIIAGLPRGPAPPAVSSSLIQLIFCDAGRWLTSFPHAQAAPG